MEDLDQLFTVFLGSSPEDVSHCRQLWSSVSLLPPLESRLVSAHIRQRLPVSAPVPGPKPSAPGPEPPTVLPLRQRQEERRRYEAMADQRREILTLLRRQRETRIHREQLSEAVKPKLKVCRDREREEQEEQEEKELVEQLQ